MTKREIASLTIKLMGVFILLRSIAYVPMAYGGVFFAFQTDVRPGLLQMLFLIMLSTATAVIPLAFSVLVILFSDKAAAWLITDDSAVEQPPDSPVTQSDVMAVAISCIGLYFIVAAAPGIIQALINNSIQRRQQIITPFGSPSAMMHFFRQMFAPAVQIALGIWLFVGSKGIANFWKKIRS